MRQSRQHSQPTHAKRLEQLATAIRAYRGHDPGRRIPQSLRTEVVTAINAGATVRELCESCKLSGSQISRWRQSAARDSGDIASVNAAEVVAPRVLSVVDEATPETSLPDGEIELRIGGWCLSLRRMAP